MNNTSNVTSRPSYGFFVVFLVHFHLPVTLKLIKELEKSPITFHTILIILNFIQNQIICWRLSELIYFFSADGGKNQCVAHTFPSAIHNFSFEPHLEHLSRAIQQQLPFLLGYREKIMRSGSGGCCCTPLFYFQFQQLHGSNGPMQHSTCCCSGCCLLLLQSSVGWSVCMRRA
jgi:hypothetical protein